MALATFRVRGISANSIFNLSHPNNRDNCFQPYYLLREGFRQHGIELNTEDINHDACAAFELDMDVRKLQRSVPTYLLLLETPQVLPLNGSEKLLSRYRKIFTWNDDLIDGDRFVKINFPNPLSAPALDGWRSRERFCCVIAGNKSAAERDSRELYSRRVEAIRWFERHAPEDFDLYGVGWESFPPGPGKLGKLWHKIAAPMSRRIVTDCPFPSYRGRIVNKQETLLKYRYAICYENVSDLSGYITEKIFDCFFAGCVPVYWGASNIADYIPAECFVDRRKFRDTGEVYSFLKNMTEHEFIGYQQQIATFLKSEAAYPFSSEFFAETIVSTIIADIDTQA